MYYLMETDYSVRPTPYRTSSLIDSFKFQASRWVTGKVLSEPTVPLRIEFWQNGGNGLADMFEDSILLFSEEMVKAVQEAGVDNLQVFPIEPVARDGLPIDKKYYAVNIIGLVQCADMGKSEYTDLAGTGMFAVAFRQLVLDEEKAGDQLMFRLAESVSSIIVHEDVKKHLENKGFRYLKFRSLSE